MPDMNKPAAKAEEAPPMTVAVPHEAYRAQQFGKAQAEAAELEMDETVPGGRYLLPDGKTFVDADGKQVTGEHKGEFAGEARGTSASMAPPVPPTAEEKK